MRKAHSSLKTYIDNRISFFIRCLKRDPNENCFKKYLYHFKMRLIKLPYIQFTKDVLVG